MKPPRGTYEELEEEVNRIWKLHRNTRSVFPYFSETKLVFERSNHFKVWNHPILESGLLSFKKPISKEMIPELNEIGGYLNQNFVIRLFALMNYYNLVGSQGSIQEGVSGCKDVLIMVKLRQHFSHSSGRVNPKRRESVNLRDEIYNFYKVDPKTQDPLEFAIPLIKVLERMKNGCLSYGKAIYELKED